MTKITINLLESEARLRSSPRRQQTVVRTRQVYYLGRRHALEPEKGAYSPGGMGIGPPGLGGQQGFSPPSSSVITLDWLADEARLTAKSEPGEVTALVGELRLERVLSSELMCAARAGRGF